MNGIDHAVVRQIAAGRRAGVRDLMAATGYFALPEQTSPFRHRSELAAGAAAGIETQSGVVDRGADGFAKLRRRNGHHGSNNGQQDRVFGR